MTKNKSIQVSVRGITPLLMHSFPMVPIAALEKKPKEEQAELATYRDPEGNLYVPGINIQRSLVAAASYTKGKGRASLQKQAAACLIVNPERVPLNQKKFAIDSRPVVVPATRGRVMRYRPRFDEWELSFTLEYDPDLIREPELREIVDNAGSRVGLLDFRPEKKGSFGRFIVTQWD